MIHRNIPSATLPPILRLPESRGKHILGPKISGSGQLKHHPSASTFLEPQQKIWSEGFGDARHPTEEEMNEPIEDQEAISHPQKRGSSAP